jgi:predicted ribosomally synthesized six-cysteine peptide SCIFF
MEKRHIITLNPEAVAAGAPGTGCGECPTSCQSACKTSCTVGNQVCLREDNKK